MAKVTSKLQVTIPKAVAREYGIQPGDDIEFQPAGAVIRVVPARSRRPPRLSPAERLRLFDDATRRQSQREERLTLPKQAPRSRGWTREDLYGRDKSR